MNNDIDMVRIFGSERAAVVAAGAAEFTAMKADPTRFLKDLEAGIELGDDFLKSSLADEDSSRRIWLGILSLADLRKINDPLWQECEPVIKRFWERVTNLGIPHDLVIREFARTEIFGEGEVK